MWLIEKIMSEKDRIIEIWFEKLVSTYPKASFNYFIKYENQFTNPVGYNLFTNLKVLMDCFLKNDFLSEKFTKSLEDILKLRYSQSNSHYESANIFQPLKLHLLNQFENSLSKNEIVELFEYFKNYEEISFNKYFEIQNLIFEIQKEEIKNRYGKILERINQRYENP
ncbi:MAG: hypothetical protein ACUVQ1_06090 [Candidatus Kapaibacteriales bacterium]